MNRHTLRLGMIGLGGVADAHLAAYRETDSVEVVAAAELRLDRLEEVTGREGIPAFSDYREMLTEVPLDIVCVTASVNSHRPIVEAAAQAGLQVFCEKPMAVTLDDAQAMLECCQKHGVKLCYGASYRFLPAVRRAREVMAEGRIGEVVLMTETAIGGQGIEQHEPMGFHHYPAGGPGGGGMGLVDHGIHLIDLFPWLVGSEITSVFGRGNISGEAPATEFMHMELANGATGHLVYNDSTFGTELPQEGQFSWGAAWDFTGYVPPGGWLPHPGSIQVYGTKGALRIFHYANRLFLNTVSGIEQLPLEGRPPPRHFASQIESFARSILREEPVEVAGEDGVRALRALVGVYESSKRGARVSVSTGAEDDPPGVT